MGTITNNIRWADNTAELKKNLLDGVNTVDAMKSSVDRLITTMSGNGLFGTANKVAAAIMEMGGVTKLTAQEQERAIGTLDKAIEKYKLMGKDAPTALIDVRNALKDASETTTGWLPILQSMGSSWVARIAEGVLLRDAIHEIVGKVKDLAMALPEIALKGAAVADVEENFKHLTDQAGLLGDTLMGTLRAGTHNTVDDFELMKAVNKDLTAGLHLTEAQFGTMATGAFALAQATGVDVKQAFDTMNEALVSGRPKALQALVGKLDLTAAEKKYAESLFSTAEHLTEEGKIEGARLGMLDAVAAATKRLGDQTDGLDERLAQLQTAWHNFTDDLGKAIAKSEVLEVGLAGLKLILSQTFGSTQADLIKGIASQIEHLEIALIGAAEAGVSAGGFLAKEWFATKKVFGDVAQVVDGVRLALLLAQQAAAAGLLPGTADFAKWKALDDQIAHLEVTMKTRGESLQEDDRAQAAVDATTAKFNKTLADLQAKMAAAKVQSDALTTSVKDETSATDKSSASAGKRTGLLKQSADEIAAAKKANEEFQKTEIEIASAGESWVATLNRINPAVVAWGLQLLKAGVSLETVRKNQGLTETQAKALENQFKFLEQTTTLTTKAFGDQTKIMGPLVARYSEMHGYITGVDAATGNLSATVLDLGMTAAPTTVDALGKVGFTTEQLRAKLKDLRLETITVGDSLSEAFTKIPDMLVKAFEGGGGLTGAMKAIGVAISQAILEPLMAGLSKASKMAVSTGSAMSSALGGAVGGGTAAAIGGIASSIGGAAIAASAWGGSMAAAGIAGSIAISAATLGVGAAAIGVYMLAKHWLGVSDAEKEARAEWGKLQDVYGDMPTTIAAISKAYDDMGFSGDVAQAAIKRALDATHESAQEENAALQPIVAILVAAEQKANAVATGVGGITAMAKIFGGAVPAQFNEAIKKLAEMKGITDDEKQALLGIVNEVKPSFEDLTKTADTYGISLAALGPKFQQADLEAASKKIFDDFTALTSAGADVGGVLAGMSDEIQKLVSDSLQFGTAIPENMKPLIENLISAGKLTDDQGNKLTDVGQLTFEKTPLSDSIDTLAKAISDLTNLLAGGGGVTDAIAKIGQAANDHIPDNPFKDWQVPELNFPQPPDYGNPYGSTGGMVTAAGIQHFARGGMVGSLIPNGSDTVPAMLTPGEMVLTAGQQRNYTAQLHAAASGPVVDLSEIRRLREELSASNARMERMLKSMPGDMSRSMRDAKLLA